MTLAFEWTDERPANIQTDAIVVGIYADGSMPEATAAVDKATDGVIQRLFASKDIKGKPGHVHVLLGLAGVTSSRVLVVGLGKTDAMTPHVFKQVSDAAYARLSTLPASHAASWLSAVDVNGKDDAWKARTEALSADYASYRYLETLTKDVPAKRSDLARVALATHADTGAALVTASAIAKGVRLARRLGNTPPNICTPEWLAAQAGDIAQAYDHVSIDVLERDEMEALGMHSLLAVAQGSANAPRLIVLEYQGAGKDAAPFALVGKGVTFDSGGLNIKPGNSMAQMKFDMCGAAGMLGTFLTAAELKLPLNLVCAVAAVENMPDGNSYRPGDVLKTLSGQTVEVLNTDAEGRLILCDTLTYVKRFKPQAIVNAATLTGACMVALGKHASGLMSKHDDLANELLAAGEETLDRAWRLPLWDVYQKDLESAFADFAHIGSRNAGAITAGCFLSRFTEGERWAHLDIAGTAWDDGRKGLATGRPVSLLSQWLIRQSA